MVKLNYTCLACGWKGLSSKPYRNLPENPHPVQVPPPYEKHWGMPSYEVCDCCGFEFGFDDNPGLESAPRTFQEHLKEWFIDGAKWFYPKTSPPADWDIVRQLGEAGIEVPEYIKVSRRIGGGQV